MSIASALFSDSQARVLVWLFGQPDRVYHLNELLRLTGLGSASLQRELNRLASAGLVNSERVGNLRQFQVNTQSPVYADLFSLVRKTLGTVPLLSNTLETLWPRLQAAWIFGSVAKQTDTASSDIDLMLIGENLPLADVLEALLPLESQLGRKINPTIYTPAEYQRRRAEPDSFVNRVLAQPTIPLLGERHEPDRTG